MMKLKPDDLRAAYDFLRRVAFHSDKRLPAGHRVEFIAKALKAHGYHGYSAGRHSIWVDTKDTRDWQHALQIMAHEMCHVVLLPHTAWCGEPHDAQFTELARIIEVEMNWPKGSV